MRNVADIIPQGSQGEKQLKMKLENLEFVKASPDGSTR
jgi:hypothetical protein